MLQKFINKKATLKYTFLNYLKIHTCIKVSCLLEKNSEFIRDKYSNNLICIICNIKLQLWSKAKLQNINPQKTISKEKINDLEYKVNKLVKRFQVLANAFTKSNILL